MYNPAHKQLTVVVYDGISNSVFQSQVLAPLLAMLQASINLEITLISFERHQPSPESLLKAVPAHDRLHLMIARKQVFLGAWSLYPAVWQFKRILQQIPCHHIITRGPLAGWIVCNALTKIIRQHPEALQGATPDALLPSVTIQARGLCAEEYRYAHRQQLNPTSHNPLIWLKKLFYHWIYKQFNLVEKAVYGARQATDALQAVTIESVSPALTNYLIQTFHANPERIVLATKDIPQPVDAALRMQWRLQMRKQLGIPESAYVYCYSGSYKPWQCADQTVADFVTRFAANPHAFLLVLTQDRTAFERVLHSYQLPNTSLTIVHAPANDLLRYLAAADAGYLFREADIINWVSRPTKMLEYQAVGLDIIHNKTVAWLAEKKAPAAT
jgi:hypothetical protein